MQLIKYDAMCKAIADAKSVDEVKDIADKALALKQYAKQAKNKKLEMDAAEIRLRSERRWGELYAASEKAKGGGDTSTGSRKVPVQEKPTLKDMGVDKKFSSKCQKLAAVPKVKFEKLIGGWRERVQKEDERVTINLLREGERHQKNDWEAPPLPEKEYQLIYADPPWRYEHSKTESRAVENQYPTMDLNDIKAMEVPCTDDCILFLWATSPKLGEAMEVMEAWGFTYKTCAIWDKEKIGMGYYFRQQHELLLVGMKGTINAPEPANRVSSVYREKRKGHSSKPEYFYGLIQKMYPNLKKIELFCRTPKNGWATWGNQNDA